ncbi:MAG: hypothetical protein FWH35_00875 [Treponema sp.]|nr:hypothetical protein [Treponema sp.]
MKRYFLYINIFILILLVSAVHSQTIRKMEFRNQNIEDILMVLADMGRQSIIVDASVTGTATFSFSDSSFEEALYQFIDACNLYGEKKNNAYYVSRIRIKAEGNYITVNAEDADIELLVRTVSREAGKTILYDPLPRTTISVHSQNISLKDFLEIIIKRHEDYSLEQDNDAFYLRHTVEAGISSPGRLGSSAISRTEEKYSMNIQRASFSSILTQLFRVAEKEYSLLQRIDSTLENLYFEEKTFEQILRLVLEQGNCDYIESVGIYYIFEVQRRDILKNFKTTMVIQLQNIPVEEAVALLPLDYSASSFLKTNKNTNSAYLTGSTGEITPIADFLSLLDIPAEDKSYRRFEIRYLKVSDFLSLIPTELAAANPQIIPESNAFMAQVNDNMAQNFLDFIALLDQRNSGIPIRLKYIKSEDLIQNLPPSIQKEEITVSSDPTLVFYTGTNEKQIQFLEQLKLIDLPKPQIRYQLLVIQYQRSDSFTWDNSFTLSSPDRTGNNFISGTFSNLLNIQFDVISVLGNNLSMQLNMQLGDDRAKVLADTALNGISGQDIKFENTTTFRYRDTTIDPDTGKPLYTGVTREITSGLILGINGWVSGDGMVTMSVNAAVSRQDESGSNASATTNPPPTSERRVNTLVRTKSGTPVIIGGLLQIEKIETTKKVPFFGSIPLLGRLFRKIDTQDVTTEMVIYIVPLVHNGDETTVGHHKKIEEYYKKYVLREL